jgi:protein TonB
MKPLLFSAGLAVILHGLVLGIEAEWFQREAPARLRVKPIAITLSRPQPMERASSHKIRGKDIQRVSVPGLQEEKRPDLDLSTKSKNPSHTRKTNPKKRVKGPPRTLAKKRPPKQQKTIQPKVTQEVDSLSNPAAPPEGRLSTKAHEEPIGLLASSPIEEANKSANLKAERIAALRHSPTPLREAVPAYRRNLQPRYPRIARFKGYEGTVVLEVLVDHQGKVGDLRLFQSSGYPVLDRAAMNSVTNWLFEPGQRGDKAVEMWVKVPVRFKLR